VTSPSRAHVPRSIRVGGSAGAMPVRGKDAATHESMPASRLSPRGVMLARALRRCSNAHAPTPMYLSYRLEGWRAGVVDPCDRHSREKAISARRHAVHSQAVMGKRHGADTRGYGIQRMLGGTPRILETRLNLTTCRLPSPAICKCSRVAPARCTRGPGESTDLSEACSRQSRCVQETALLFSEAGGCWLAPCTWRSAISQRWLDRCSSM
jgi:hypothetical protein